MRKGGEYKIEGGRKTRLNRETGNYDFVEEVPQEEAKPVEAAEAEAESPSEEA